LHERVASQQPPQSQVVTVLSAGAGIDELPIFVERNKGGDAPDAIFLGQCILDIASLPVSVSDFATSQREIISQKRTGNTTNNAQHVSEIAAKRVWRRET
jgi:DsbC/DsbD-like thiol-disulfide interchange protein